MAGVDKPRTEAQRHEDYIRALLEERWACEVRGRTDRVAQINEQLGEVAKGAQAPAERAQKRPYKRRVEQRSAETPSEEWSPPTAA